MIGPISAGAAEWPFPPIRRFLAIDGQDPDISREMPAWWSLPAPDSRAGQWGCYLSHIQVLEEARARGDAATLILEDDVFFCPSLARRYAAFAAAVPDDWEQVFLGGNISDPTLLPPRMVNPLVLAPGQVLATHAYLVRGSAISKLLASLTDEEFLRSCGRHAIDRFYAALHATRRFAVYCPRGRWLAGQSGGWSDIRRADNGDPRYWNCERMEGDTGQGTGDRD
jgi:GR25 family glycosyltransferase involved in LPS biosynthesis